MRSFGWLVVAGVGVACAQTTPTRGQANSLGQASAGSARAPAASAPGSGSAALLPGATPRSRGSELLTRSWPEAIQLGLWGEAEQHFARLGEQDRARPLLRYARARVAKQLGEPARVVELLTDLADKPPSELSRVRGELGELLAEAQLEAGPFEAAAAFYQKQGGVDGLIHAARAYERAGKLDQARRLISQAVERASRAGRDRDGYRKGMVEARRLRADVSKKLGRKNLAALDLRWLAVQVPAHELARGADVELEEYVGKRELTKTQRYDRAERFADASQVDAVEAELDRLQSAPGASPRPADVLRTRAWAYYKSRRDYLKASELFAEAAKLDANHRPDDLFYEARALSRAHRDAEAIEKYLALAKQYPTSRIAEQARFRAARLYFMLGRWSEAEAAFDDYLKRYGSARPSKRRGRFESTVQYELGLTYLLTDKAKRAEATFRTLLSGTRDDRREAQLTQLLAVAKLHQGDEQGSAKLFREVMHQRPLSFAALVSAARLKQIGAELVPWLPSSADEEPWKPLDPKLPADAKFFADLGFDDDAEALLARQEDALRKRYHPRGGEAVCQLYAELSTAARRYRFAQKLIRAESLARAPSPGNRWAWDCIYPEPYRAIVDQMQQRHLLPSGLLYAVMRQESGFRPRVSSPAAARGLLQLIEPTARRVAKELQVEFAPELLDSPPYNIRFGAHYLAGLLDVFKGSEALALAGYNAGPQAVKRWIAKGQRMPLDLWVAHIPYTETRNYVARVLGNWARYRYLDGGAAAVTVPSLELPEGIVVPTEAY